MTKIPKVGIPRTGIPKAGIPKVRKAPHTGTLPEDRDSKGRDSEVRYSENRDSESRDSEARDSEEGQIHGPLNSDPPLNMFRLPGFAFSSRVVKTSAIFGFVWAELKGGGQNVPKSETSRGWPFSNHFWRPSESCL